MTRGVWVAAAVTIVLALAGCGDHHRAPRAADPATELRAYLAQVEPIRLSVNELLDTADPILSGYHDHRLTAKQAESRMDALERRFAGYTVGDRRGGARAGVDARGAGCLRAHLRPGGLVSERPHGGDSRAQVRRPAEDPGRPAGCGDRLADAPRGGGGAGSACSCRPICSRRVAARSRRRRSAAEPGSLPPSPPAVRINPRGQDDPHRGRRGPLPEAGPARARVGRLRGGGRGSGR